MFLDEIKTVTLFHHMYTFVIILYLYLIKNQAGKVNAVTNKVTKSDKNSVIVATRAFAQITKRTVQQKVHSSVNVLTKLA